MDKKSYQKSENKNTSLSNYIKIVDKNVDEVTKYIFSENELRLEFYIERKLESRAAIDMTYLLYKPYIDNTFKRKSFYFGRYDLNIDSFGYSNGIIYETDEINKKVMKNLFDFLVAIDKSKVNRFRTEIDKYIDEYNDFVKMAIPNLLNLISKECMNSIEGYFALRYGIFKSEKSFLQNYYIVIKNGETISNYKRIISNEKYYIDSFYINFFRNVAEERYDSLRAFLIEYAPKGGDYKGNNSDGYRKARDKYFEKNRKDNDTFISMVESCISTFMDYIKVVQNRFSFDFIKARDVSWLVFNLNMLKIYHDKWLEYCVCGDIGERSLEDYIRDCCNEDMLSIENKGPRLITYHP